MAQLDMHHGMASAGYVRLARRTRVPPTPCDPVCGVCVAGIWPMMDNPEADPSACQRSTNGSMLAVVNEAGALRLYSWPPVSKTVRRRITWPAGAALWAHWRGAAHVLRRCRFGADGVVCVCSRSTARSRPMPTAHQTSGSSQVRTQAPGRPDSVCGC